MKPLKNMIVLRVCNDGPSKTGLYLPKSANYDFKRGEVVAVGPGAKNQEGVHLGCDVKVGDFVLYRPEFAAPLRVDDNELLLIPEEYLAMIIEPSDLKDETAGVGIN